MLIIALLFMILLAAKGPLLFLILLMGIKYRKKLRITNFKFWFSLGLIISSIYLFVTLTKIRLFDTLIDRLSFFSGGLDADESSLARVILLKKGIELIRDNIFFGVGIGGYAKGIGDPDGRLSPHNVFIEVWAETGVIPLTLLLILCILLFIKYSYLLKKYQFRLGENIIYLCLFIFFSNMVSSYLEDMRITYFWLGTSIAYYTIKIKTFSNLI
jgi:O-antigen ligase